MTSLDYYGGEDDGGGVHINSGVNNKAAFLLTDGGTFNGQTVQPLGIDKVARLYYMVEPTLLTSAADYQDLASALQQACQTLIAAGVTTAADCVQVTTAVNATEMTLEPPAAAAPEAPVCPAGQVNTCVLERRPGKSGRGPLDSTEPGWRQYLVLSAHRQSSRLPRDLRHQRPHELLGRRSGYRLGLGDGDDHVGRTSGGRLAALQPRLRLRGQIRSVRTTAASSSTASTTAAAGSTRAR